MIDNFILDVDGVMTDGKIYFGKSGKIFKVFGAHDHDGLTMIKDYCNIEFVTADSAGEKISRSRIVDHMGYKLTTVSAKDRLQWLKNNFNLTKTAYMGDGIFDAEIFPHVAVSIAPQNARLEAKSNATYITPNASAEGAVLDACLFLLKRIKNAI